MLLWHSTMRSVGSIVFNVGTVKKEHFTAIYGVKEKCKTKTGKEWMSRDERESEARAKTLFDVRELPRPTEINVPFKGNKHH